MTASLEYLCAAAIVLGPSLIVLAALFWPIRVERIEQNRFGDTRTIREK